MVDYRKHGQNLETMQTIGAKSTRNKLYPQGKAETLLSASENAAVIST